MPSKKKSEPKLGSHQGPAAEGLRVQAGANIREDNAGPGPARDPHEGYEGITREARRMIAERKRS